MKVLWFTNTTSLFNKSGGASKGGGWIESLEELITSRTDITLGVCFLYEDKLSNFKVINGKTSYYPIKTINKKNLPIKLIKNLTSSIGSEKKLLPQLLDVIEDFKPDLINVFGTEKLFGLVQKKTKIPVVIHLQGILNPILDGLTPVGHSIFDFSVSKNFLLKNFIGTSPYFDLKKTQKAALRELEIIELSNYFMGRTTWDYNVMKLYNSHCSYFHIDEVLRDDFYNKNTSIYKKEKVLKIVSTISASTYKGIDIILKTSKLLKHLEVDFNWTVIGIKQNDPFLRYFAQKQRLNLGDYPLHFVGKKESKEMIEIHLKSDVYIHTSYIDNSPNSVCEAQILGLPIIACNVGGLESIINNEVTGFLVPANGIHEICHILKNKFQDEILINDVKLNAQNTANERHDKQRILNSLIEAYKTILIAEKN